MRSHRPGIVKNVVATVNPSQCPTTPLNNLGKLAPGDLLHTVTSSTRSAAPGWVVPSSSQQPTFDRFMNIRADIVYCFALGDASRQCWHFRPVSTFFRFMNEHLQCHESILLHRRIPRKTDLWRLSSASRS